MKLIINFISRTFVSSALAPNQAFTGFVNESPDLQEKRAAAIVRMNSFGRKSLLQGGEFNLNNHCLKSSDTHTLGI